MATAESSRRVRWLPEGKRCAVCFSIDDIHPAKSSDYYEAGGDLDRGALGHVSWLLERHPLLHVTLFTTPDWREISPRPTRKLLSRVPFVRDRVFHAPVLRSGAMRLDRHPDFVAYLRGLPRTEIGLHGLHHVHTGPKIPVEFQDESVAECKRILRRSMALFEAAGLPHASGLAPPGWNAPPALLSAMAELGLSFIASARDINTAVSADARANMSGLKGVSLILPEPIENGRIVQFTSNFQATSPIERAFAILDLGGLLAIKAHIVKDALGHVALDGMDTLYRNYLDVVFRELRSRYGDGLWWTSMGEIAERMKTEADWESSAISA